jgi:hypothetical protein
MESLKIAGLANPVLGECRRISFEAEPRSQPPSSMTAPYSTQRMIDRMKKSVQRFPRRRVLEGEIGPPSLQIDKIIWRRPDHFRPGTTRSSRIPDQAIILDCCEARSSSVDGQSQVGSPSTPDIRSIIRHASDGPPPDATQVATGWEFGRSTPADVPLIHVYRCGESF